MARLWCRKSPQRVSSRLGFAMRRLENSVIPTVSGYLFRTREAKGEGWARGMGSAFHQLCPRYSGTLTPTAPTTIRLWETFTFYLARNIQLRVYAVEEIDRSIFELQISSFYTDIYKECEH